MGECEILVLNFMVCYREYSDIKVIIIKNFMINNFSKLLLLETKDAGLNFCSDASLNFDSYP